MIFSAFDTFAERSPIFRHISPMPSETSERAGLTCGDAGVGGSNFESAGIERLRAGGGWLLVKAFTGGLAPMGRPPLIGRPFSGSASWGIDVLKRSSGSGTASDMWL